MSKMKLHAAMSKLAIGIGILFDKAKLTHGSGQG